jgi:ribosomal protein S18 acetylase RimI-like enzyme
MTTSIRPANGEDAAALAALAAATFALACPPGTTQKAVDDFLASSLSETSFARYIKDSQRLVLLACDGEAAVGYAMLVFSEPTDPNVLASITVRPTSELSKLYVLADHHGAGVSSALVDAGVAAARERGCVAMWLGVNQLNLRANRFYEKSGFVRVGTKTFALGGKLEEDFVRERLL